MHFMSRLVFPLVLLPLLAACSSPGPLPEEMAANLPAQRQLSPATQERVRKLTQDALLGLLAGNYPLATQEALAAIAVDPRAARARAVLGRCLLQQAQEVQPPELSLMQRAEGEMLRAKRLDPDDPEIGVFYAQFLIIEGHLSRAAEELDQVLGLHANHLSALRTASEIRYEMGEERAALPLLQRLLVNDPEDSQAVYRLGHCQLRLAEAAARRDSMESPMPDPQALYQQAALSFQRYQSLQPGNADGFLGEGHALFQAMCLSASDEADAAAVEKVLGTFKQAGSLRPKSPVPLHSRAVVHEYLGRLPEAQSLYELALLLNPDYLPSILNLAALAAAAGDHQAALEYCRHALQLDPSVQEKRKLQAFLDKHADSSAQ